MSGRPARVVVAGAGPAGFYVAINLLRLFGPSGVRVDVLERLPVPFGLVRFGIAPDHAHTRAVTSRFDRAVRDHGDALRVHVNAGVRTQLGREGVPVNELMRASDALVLCTGLSAEPGYGDGRRHDQQQRLRGVLDAREVVDWYNGHPYARADVGETLRNVLHSEDARGVAVLGVGNVALDIARMLALDPVSLSRTDAAPAAIEVLSSGSDFPRLVHMIGRRSLAQASFTPKEVRELLSLLSARVTSGNDDGLAIDATDEIVMRENRIRKRALEAVRKHVTSPPSPAQDSQPTREVRMHFRRTPIDIVEDEVRSGHVGGIRLRVTPPAWRKVSAWGVNLMIMCRKRSFCAVEQSSERSDTEGRQSPAFLGTKRKALCPPLQEGASSQAMTIRLFQACMRVVGSAEAHRASSPRT